MSLKSLIKSITLPLTGLIGFSLLLITQSAIAAQQEHDPHAHHKMMMDQTGYKSSVHNYTIPDLILIDMHSNRVSLSEALGDEGPVILKGTSINCLCPLALRPVQKQGALLKPYLLPVEKA